MKKALFIFFLFPLLGITEKKEVVKVKIELESHRPTLDQELQLLKNKIKTTSSKINCKIAEIKYLENGNN